MSCRKAIPNLQQNGCVFATVTPQSGEARFLGHRDPIECTSNVHVLTVARRELKLHLIEPASYNSDTLARTVVGNDLLMLQL
jgi:hypothetical protein